MSIKRQQSNLKANLRKSSKNYTSMKVRNDLSLKKKKKVRRQLKGGMVGSMFSRMLNPGALPLKKWGYEASLLPDVTTETPTKIPQNKWPADHCRLTFQKDDLTLITQNILGEADNPFEFSNSENLRFDNQNEIIKFYRQRENDEMKMTSELQTEFNQLQEKFDESIETMIKQLGDSPDRFINDEVLQLLEKYKKPVNGVSKLPELLTLLTNDSIPLEQDNKNPVDNPEKYVRINLVSKAFSKYQDRKIHHLCEIGKDSENPL
tara:strand:+ start:75 stop:863 length:789 start_codon:yes stop_codon:yes gene_type:complete